MQWFENPAQYVNDTPLPAQMMPYNPALVRVYAEGRTEPGWGAEKFSDNHAKGVFGPARALRFYEKFGQPFAIIMRAMPLICVDIDGKNGGVETAQVLQLPPSLAETSKSGNGFHVYYYVPGMQWIDHRGYEEFPDMIGLVPGVDIKGTGVVYHHNTQLWNTLDVAPLPGALAELLGRARDIKRYTRAAAGGMAALDEDEKVIIWDGLLAQLASPKVGVEGKRNNRLYAIGSQMFASGVPNWDLKLFDRGLEVGSTPEKMTALIKNIEKYA